MATLAEQAPSAPGGRAASTSTELQTGRIVTAHLAIAFAAFVVAAMFGVWQMWARSPLAAPYLTEANYFRSVTYHGVSMAYVLSTFFIMGFGYYVGETSLKRPVPGLQWAWLGFWVGLIGVLMAAISILSGNASVLYTFYPPLTATPWFYIGLVLVVVASWVWCVIMIVAMREWKVANPGKPVPLAMYGTVANAVMWLWTTLGVAAELLFQVIPAAFGWTQTIDVGLSRTLFSWTLHPIVYFWLLPSYVAFYTMAPRAAGGRLLSDTMGRIAFVAFILYSLPVGMHHLMMDPEQSNAFKFLQVFLTAIVSVPTMLTVFTIMGSLEIAGRMRGGKGLFGWIAVLPWDRPMVLATGLAFVMLFWGGGGGLINMSYGMNAMVHNTSWVTAHFHLIFGGTVVIMYFAIAYAIWPSLSGRSFETTKPLLAQLWMWFIGMMVMTLPWHWVGLEGQWRRDASFDYSNPIVHSWGPWVIVSLVGGIILALSALLFVYNLMMLYRRGSRAGYAPVEYARAVHPPEYVPAALNGFGLWNVLVVVLMLVSYGYPIAQFFIQPPPQAMVHRLG